MAREKPIAVVVRLEQGQLVSGHSRAEKPMGLHGAVARRCCMTRVHRRPQDALHTLTNSERLFTQAHDTLQN